MHTEWSDGRDSVEAMVQACRGARLRVHRDHRPLAAFRRPSRNLSVDGVATAGRRNCRAARAVSGDRDPARLRGRHPARRPPRLPRSHPRALRHRAGVAARAAGQSPEQLLPRYVARDAASAGDADHASDQPPGAAPAAATISTTTRCSRRPSRPDTLVEIDGAPAHLDLDGALARRAIAAGATRRHRQRLPPRRTARAPDGARRHDRAARLGRAAPRRQHPAARRVRAFIAAKRAPIADARRRPPLVVGARRLRSLSRDAAARLGPRRHRVVPDHGRPADHHAARRLSALLRHRPVSSSRSSTNRALRAEPGARPSKRRSRAA